MPRAIVIGIFVVLGLGIVIGGGLLVWQQFFGGAREVVQAPDATVSTTGQLQPASESDRIGQSDGGGDDDGDGLLNSDELVWSTDPSNPDTDGDGFLDGEEVAANHDPTRPAPDDLLGEESEPSGGTPTQNVLTSGTVEQLFVDDLDVSGGDANITEQYRDQISESEQSLATMTDFAQAQEIITQLPRPSEELAPTLVEDSSSTLAAYVSNADNRNALANPTAYQQAVYRMQVEADSSSMQSIAAQVRAYRESLTATPVPASAEPVHMLLLGYTELLAATFDQIALWSDDPVRSMVASRQLEFIDQLYYPVIHDELQRLQALQ